MFQYLAVLLLLGSHSKPPIQAAADTTQFLFDLGRYLRSDRNTSVGAQLDTSCVWPGSVCAELSPGWPAHGTRSGMLDTLLAGLGTGAHAQDDGVPSCRSDSLRLFVRQPVFKSNEARITITTVCGYDRTSTRVVLEIQGDELVFNKQGTHWAFFKRKSIWAT